MKISFLSDTIYPYNKGGKETRSYELAKELGKTIIQAVESIIIMKNTCINSAKQYDWSNLIEKFEGVYGN